MIFLLLRALDFSCSVRVYALKKVIIIIIAAGNEVVPLYDVYAITRSSLNDATTNPVF
jgi:hypothetical protein